MKSQDGIIALHAVLSRWDSARLMVEIEGVSAAHKIIGVCTIKDGYVSSRRLKNVPAASFHTSLAWLKDNLRKSTFEQIEKEFT